MTSKKHDIFEKWYNRFRYYPLEEFVFGYSSFQVKTIYHENHMGGGRVRFLLILIFGVVYFPMYSVLDYFIDYDLDIIIYLIFCIILAFCFDFYFAGRNYTYGRYCVLFSRESDQTKRRWILYTILFDISVFALSISIMILIHKTYNYILPLIFE